MDSVKSILITGVGGQGTLLAARILGDAAIRSGYEAKVSEVHGMSQRGGSVVTYVRYGKSVVSPLICEGEADVILSFEVLEAARCLPYLKKGGVVVTSTQEINPMPVISGAAKYPGDLINQMKAAGVRVISADALSIARAAGSIKASNVALIGLGADLFGFSHDVLYESIISCVPEKAKAVNEAAFKGGLAAASQRHNL